jgi:penicillin amidase
MTKLRGGLAALGVCAALAACGGNGAKSTSTTTTTGSGGGGHGGSGGAGGSASGVSIPGLSAPVEAAYDANGLLHLTCAADDDCFAALGYFHASNRFFFMDFVRNLVEGSLGSIVKAGQLVLSQDFVNRQWFCTRQGVPLEQALYSAASPEVQGHMNAYTKGVNAWLADLKAGKNGASLTTEYGFALIVETPENIRAWAPEDSAAVGLYVLDDLSNNSASELEAAKDLPLLSPVVGAELFSLKPVFPAFTVPAATGMPPAWHLPGPGGSLAGLLDWRSTLSGARSYAGSIGLGAKARLKGDVGSNDWVVAPSQTANGHALLANDPHLPLMNPSVWFPVEIDAKSKGKGTYHMAGSTFPGLPSVMVGQNEKIAWGVTTAYYDMADEYLETLAPGGAGVMFNGQAVPFFTKSFTFQNAAGSPVTQTFQWVPHHGPVVSIDMTKGTAVSIRWTGHEQPNTDLDAFFAVGRSGTVAEAKAGLAMYASSANQNFVLVDTAGNIGWYPFSKVPSRPWASAQVPPWLPLPGDGSAEWQGTVPIASLPALTNPPKGFVATANNDMTGASADGDPTNDGVPAIQAWDKADGTREQRIVDLLVAGGTTHSAATMHQIQGDTYSLYGSFVVPPVLAAAQSMPLTPAEQAVVTALTNWKYTCPTGLTGNDPVMSPKATDATASESIGCTAFHTVLYAIVRDAIGDEEAMAGVDVSDMDVSLRLVARSLHDPTSCDQGFWDNVSTPQVETQADILRQAITDAAAVLAPIASPDDWRWGRMHTLTLASIFNDFGVTTYNAGPFAAPGGQFTVNVATPSNQGAPAAGAAPDYSFANGPSLRMVVEATPTGLTMTYELPGGADLHRMSPFYNNLLPGWLANQPVPFPFGPGAVTSPASTIVVSPAP